MSVPRMLPLTALRPRQLLPALCIVLTVCLLFFFFQRESEYTVVASVVNDSNAINSTNADKGTPPAIETTEPVLTEPVLTEPALTEPAPMKPKYKPQPTWIPPPVKDPFPLLSLTNPPPVPSWNQPKNPNIYHVYGLPVAPPLLIGFTRSWPMLLQTVVGYITAGWPAEQIFVVENTGVHDANARGRLSLQNPFYLNYTQLEMLNVTIVRTPVLLSFAQLQNYFVSVAKEKLWPYYFWSHMDSFVLSYEEGMEGISGPVGTPEYQTIYDLAIKELNYTIHSNQKWGARFFAYDHFTLVNPSAYDEVGGFDTFIPYYMTDCDMHWRLEEAGWSIKEAKAGIVEDVAPKSTAAECPPEETEKRSVRQLSTGGTTTSADNKASDSAKETMTVAEALKSFKKLYQISHDMLLHKQGDRGRNTWQLGQRGGDPREPYYYDALGFQVGIDVMTEAGREAFRRKWGHQGCDFGAAGLKPGDAWKVEKDWE
ncbi:uncharacterized protein ColSpa_06039 [Colletotrichum spaethianum]|uniref:Uncharacterized protein n=1 Tax=Colletotrichum spaethianum TaxID=700344 RepID=A0AA37LG42_9PEZI|nr:uncharacterized protein ColSpa_06039 [Colletotrichum spaethianum]GKT45858.1 hypothetical protein ColSpa_06039 [Colletotrichum spaethianum]